MGHGGLPGPPKTNAIRREPERPHGQTPRPYGQIPKAIRLDTEGLTTAMPGKHRLHSHRWLGSVAWGLTAAGPILGEGPAAANSRERKMSSPGAHVFPLRHPWGFEIDRVVRSSVEIYHVLRSSGIMYPKTLVAGHCLGEKVIAKANV